MLTDVGFVDATEPSSAPTPTGAVGFPATSGRLEPRLTEDPIMASDTQTPVHFASLTKSGAQSDAGR